MTRAMVWLHLIDLPREVITSRAGHFIKLNAVISLLKKGRDARIIAEMIS